MKLTRRLPRLTAATAALALTLAACGGGKPPATSASTTGGARSGGVATFALPPGAEPNYILPFFSGAHASVVNNRQFKYLFFVPMYWFGKNGQPVFNERLSLAYPPRYSRGGRVVTVRLKGWKWSDGETVDAKDVMFWMHLLQTEKKNWYGYVPGGFPDNVSSVRATSALTVQFTLERPYNQTWFTYNELSQILPLPSRWDRTRSGPSDCAAKVADCPAVYRYLTAQAASPATYARNPLWQVVDGPWRLAAYNTTGYVKMVPNPRYSGPDKPHLSAFVEQPFTSDSSEVNALLAGRISYGYLPYTDLHLAARLRGQGYRLHPWVGWSINYFPENFNNPKLGPVFRQLYFRQAFQHLVDQPLDVKVAYHGYGYPTYGPVPLKPANPWVTGAESHNPYPFSVAAAKALLSAHGWKVVPGGVDTCTGSCGPGIARGTRLVISLQYESGSPSVSTVMQELKTNASRAGIQLELSTAPFNQIIANAAPCTPSQAACRWQMENWGGGWVYEPDFYPTGGELFATGAGSNFGSFSDPSVDRAIARTHEPGATLASYQRLLMRDLPVVWQANADYQISVVKADLGGTTPQDPLLYIYPQSWYLKK